MSTAPDPINSMSLKHWPMTWSHSSNNDVLPRECIYFRFRRIEHQFWFNHLPNSSRNDIERFTNTSIGHPHNFMCRILHADNHHPPPEHSPFHIIVPPSQRL